MENLSDINTIKEILSRHGFNFSKSLGQNFLINDEICPMMAEESGTRKGTGVLEIGAGIGVLTAELAERAEKVVSVELDNRLLSVLGETLYEFNNVKIINADILKVDLKKLIEDEFGDMPVNVCANLPYYITSPVITRLLTSRIAFEGITVMVQAEVAQRLCCPVGKRDAGAITVLVNYYSKAEKLFDVSKNSFLPSPKVDSAVIKLNIGKDNSLLISNEKFFFNMVRAAFAQRRKTALNSISSGMSIDKSIVLTAIKNSGFNENIRADSMSMKDLAVLSEKLYKLI